MRQKTVLLILGILVLALPAGAQKGGSKFKSVEVRPFTRAEGIELSPEFTDFLYAEMKKELQKTKLYEQILGEGEVVDAADAPHSLIVEGRLLEYSKGSRAKEYLVGFGAGRRSLVTRLTVRRRSNNEALLDEDFKVRSSSFANEKLLASFLADKIAGHIKKRLK